MNTIVVGGGPAGLSAAVEILRAGGKVTIIESAPRLGGQYWRHDASGEGSHDFARFRTLREEIMNDSHASVLTSSRVWSALYQNGLTTMHVLTVQGEATLVSSSVLLATGAYDRSLPFPGWDLPGVMTAGGAQALLKGQNVALGKDVIVGGTGPFLLPVAAGLIEAGVNVIAVLEANLPTRWLPHLLRVDVSKVKEGQRYLSVLRKSGTPIRFGRAVIGAHGHHRVEEATVAALTPTFAIKPGSFERFKCDALAIGWGFTPDLSLATSLGVHCEVVRADGSVVVSVDERQMTSHAGIYAAGEITGVGGVELSLVEGRIAGIAMAFSQGLITDPAIRSAGLVTTRKKLRAFATSLAHVYRVADGWRSWLEPETLLCRCEEVSLHDVMHAVHELGAIDTRTAKLFTRCGMGMCQGRICERNVSEIVAGELGKSLSDDERRSHHNRPIVTPVPLGTLAQESPSE